MRDKKIFPVMIIHHLAMVMIAQAPVENSF